jgi:hypothetical protein
VDSVPEITDEVIEVSLPACVADFFFDAFEAAEFEFRASASFLGTDALGHIVSDLAIEVITEFGVEVFFGLLFAKKSS